MSTTNYLKIMAVAVPVFLMGCRGQRSKEPPVHPILNMDMQSRVEAQEEVDFFTDDRAMRQPVEGTVARGNLREDKALYEGINEDSSFVEESPIAVTKKFLKRGQKQYNIYCTPCHGIAGDGEGIIMTGGYGYVPAPTFHQQRLRNVKDGYIYSVISNGIRNMPSYAHQIQVKDRWAIVAYVRALQKSQNVPENEIQQYDVDLASMQEEARQKMAQAQKEQEQQKAASGGAEEITAAKGKQIAAENACQTCHSVDGSKMTGPTWKNAFGHEVQLQDGSTVTADEEYLTESIVNSSAKVVKGYQAVMPNYDFLSETEVQSLVAYIKSLSNAAPTEGSETESTQTEGSTSGAEAESESADTTGTEATQTETTTNQQQTTPADTANTESTTTAAANTAASDTTDTTKTAETTETLSVAARSGKKLFQSFECLSCHTVDGSSQLAPPLKGLYGSARKLQDGTTVEADEGYIKESIQYPRAKVALGYNGYMPSFRDLMTDQELDAITEYIKSLSEQN